MESLRSVLSKLANGGGSLVVDRIVENLDARDARPTCTCLRSTRC